jgi:LDH2 family malate/lactate/ureidoglycolate dehydrogenase
MVVKSADELHQFTRDILMSAGADERNADTVAEHLVLSHLSGVDTHGVWHVPLYLKGIREGYIVPTACPEILKETPSSALVGGNWTFGHVVAEFAMEVAIQKAQDQGIAVVAHVQTNHIGRVGHYVEMAAAERMISMVWTGGFGVEQPATVPYGGRERVLHTNPVAMGFPAGEESPMMFDYATTALSGVKVVNAYRRKQELPPGCIVDKAGNPTTDPKGFFEGGGHLPFGEHKGYALMMATEFLGRIFSGADIFADPEHGGPVLRHQGVTMIVLRADLFQPWQEYAQRADEMERRVRAIPPAPGFREVLVPGDPEVRTRAIREREGIPVADDIWQQLTDLAKSLGVTVPA